MLFDGGGFVGETLLSRGRTSAQRESMFGVWRGRMNANETDWAVCGESNARLIG